jgi:hypothetical protein
MSAYLPGISRPSATVKFAELPSIGSGYDGGFTQGLPCPPGKPQLPVLQLGARTTQFQRSPHVQQII